MRAVDRLTGAVERHSTACIEFRPGAGLWAVVSFADEAAHARWLAPVKAAFRLLADSGFGGERSRGWGRAEAPEFIEGTLPDIDPAEPCRSKSSPVASHRIPNRCGKRPARSRSGCSPCSPPRPAIQSTGNAGNYTVVARGGRVESPAVPGDLKKQVQMVAEGSVLYADRGAARIGARRGARGLRAPGVPRRVRTRPSRCPR